jgi:hypothetical protein
MVVSGVLQLSTVTRIRLFYQWWILIWRSGPVQWYNPAFVHPSAKTWHLDHALLLCFIQLITWINFTVSYCATRIERKYQSILVSETVKYINVENEIKIKYYILVFWVETLYSFISICQCLWESCCLHLQKHLSWKWTHHVPPE